VPLQNNYLNLSELVRSIQRSAGELDCFRRGQPHCDNLECTWRSLCMEFMVNSTIREVEVQNNKEA
jgi:hypothetical protein